MNNLLHWGEQLHWTPVVCLGIGAVLVFLTRMLTVWFYMRTLRAIHGGASDVDSVTRVERYFSTRKPAVPPIVSSLYFLSGIALIVSTLWGLVGTAWWTLPLGVVSWWLIHIPYREVMESWASFQRASEMAEDTDALLKGGLTTDQETAIKKRLGLNK